MRIFVDTNVLVDTLVTRQNPSFSLNSATLLSLKGNRGYTFCVSVLSLATCFYFLKDREDATARMRMLTGGMTVLDSNESDFTAAMQAEISDHEDAMQASVAARHGCDVIVTRDRRGFLKSSVPFMTPEDFLSRVPTQG